MTAYLLVGGDTQTAVTVKSSSLSKGDSFAVVNQNKNNVKVNYYPKKTPDNLTDFTLAPNSSVIFVCVTDKTVTLVSAIIDRVLNPPSSDNGQSANVNTRMNMNMNMF
jgi:hypothetical protein